MNVRIRPDSPLFQEDSVVTPEERRAQWDEYLAAAQADAPSDVEAMREMIAANPEGARLEMVAMASEIRELKSAQIDPATQADAEDAARYRWWTEWAFKPLHSDYHALYLSDVKTIEEVNGLIDAARKGMK